MELNRAQIGVLTTMDREDGMSNICQYIVFKGDNYKNVDEEEEN